MEVNRDLNCDITKNNLFEFDGGDKYGINWRWSNINPPSNCGSCFMGTI
jgi:hypothetical protein